MGYVTSAFRNFFSYLKEFGIQGAFQVIINNRRDEILSSIRPKGYGHPLFYRKGTTDFAILRHVIGQELVFKQVNNPKLIIDAGANVGYVSIYYANRHKESTILSIEMESSNFEVLKKNVAGYSNVVPIHAALWNHSDGVTFNESGSKDAYSLLHADTNVQTARSVTLLDLLKANEVPDIIKLDIEGAEVEVLGFMKEKNIQPQVLVIELHDRFRKNCSEALKYFLGGRPYIHQKIYEYDVFMFS